MKYKLFIAHEAFFQKIALVASIFCMYVTLQIAIIAIISNER